MSPVVCENKYVILMMIHTRGKVRGSSKSWEFILGANFISIHLIVHKLFYSKFNLLGSMNYCTKWHGELEIFQSGPSHRQPICYPSSRAACMAKKDVKCVNSGTEVLIEWWKYDFVIFSCYLPAEPHLDVEMESPVWTVESLHNIETLRPLTPTGCLVDSDPDLLIRSKPTSPAVEEVEQPQTPGRDIVAELEGEDSADKVLSLSPTSTEHILVASDPVASSHQDRPKTPGREDKSERTLYSSVRAPPTPGRETAMSESSTVMWPTLSSPPTVPCLSINPYITAPKTPGRDIILPRRAIVHRRKTQMVTTSQPLLCDSHGGSPISVSSPCSLSESSSNSPDGRGTWISSGVKTKPLQGLENMLGLLDEDNRRETEKSLLRRKWLRRLKRRWRIHQRQRSLKRIAGSLSSHSHPHRWRSLCEERRILHRVWKEGLDEEDARLLQCAYDRLQAQHNGLGWISDTLWTPHPHILFYSFMLNLERRTFYI